MVTNIIFDADDTLWKVEELYDKQREEFVSLMVDLGLGPKHIVEQLAKETDLKNLATRGLDTTRFPQSLVETYEARCKALHQLEDDAIKERVRTIGAKVFALPASNYDGVRETLQALKPDHALYLWTQGDKTVQENRIAQSGLRDLFTDIEIVDEKTHEGLQGLLRKWGLDPEQTWMVGNSIKSDITPALEAGLSAVWIPTPTWTETNELPPFSKDQVYLLDKFSDLREVFLEEPHRAPAAEDMVYLFVSAYHSLYRQYVLDILANPHGFAIRFPYRSAWVPRPYQSQEQIGGFCARLEGKPALIVFSDERVKGEPRRSPSFLPIRTAKITKAELHGELVQIEFVLSHYVSYTDKNKAVEKYDRDIKTLRYRPRLNPVDCFYISLGPTFVPLATPESVSDNDDRDWQNTVGVIADLRAYVTFNRRRGVNHAFPEVPNPFQYAMFYRVSGLTDLKTGQDVPLQSKLVVKGEHESDSGFMLQSDAEYRLGLLFFVPKHPESEVRRSKVQIKLSPDKALTAIGQTEIPLNFSYDNRNIDFSTARTFEDQRGSIALSIVAPSATSADDPKQPMAPAPVFLVRIKANRFLFGVAAGIFLIGGAASSLRDPLSKVIAAAVPALKGSEAAISVALGLIGSLMTTGVVYYLYRGLK